MDVRLPDDLLARLAAATASDAVDELDALGLLTAGAAHSLADAALKSADTQTETAERWLELAARVNRSINFDLSVSATILYVRARIALLSGDMDGAEDNLRAARNEWQALGDVVNVARTGLGLTQILAMQGRYPEAEAASRAAITVLEAAGDGAQLQLLGARQNLATVLSYEERHAEAMAEQEDVRAALTVLMATADPETLSDLRRHAIRNDMAIALSLMYLDRPADAEQALFRAIELADLADETVDRGRARTNLGALYSRTGRYALALEQLNAATVEILGTLNVEAATEQWPLADVLFLEQATTLLALNLLAEAEAALLRAIQLFRRTQRDYELGQALYYSGLVAWRRNDPAAAKIAFDEAIAIFEAIGNSFWLHRLGVAQAGLALRQGELAAAAGQIVSLSQDTRREALAVVRWDRPTVAELRLLEVELALASNDIITARRAAADAGEALGISSPDSTESGFLPHLQIRLVHALGQIERSDGNAARARQLFQLAIEQLEQQRAALPLEELRTSFLADKTTIYADLVLSLLAAPAPDTDAISNAFAVVERARSRALLERLLAAVGESQVTADSPSEADMQMAEIRRQLYWLYNQLLSDSGSSRHVSPTLTEEIRSREAALQRMEWHVGGWLEQAEPVRLDMLQSVLAADQQALAFYVADGELLAFVVSPDSVRIARSLCRLDALYAAQADVRFQLGRVEIGDEYVFRHGARLLAGVRSALRRLYELVVGPVRHWLTRSRLLVIPYGPLHLAPFQALWDGNDYLVGAFEITYAPSASVAVYRRRRHVQATRATMLAALALRDAGIPQAEAEAHAAATYFRHASLYLGTDAGLEGLRRAAAEADVLHVATHGLFRPDNPFFSALKLADGWIDVRQIYRLSLKAALVVLSACESGAVLVQSGDEPIGLARGFLAAGAETLVVSLWNVHDASAAELMRKFYAQLTSTQDVRPASALRHVQCEAASAGRHPYYWAPYIVIGD